MDLNGVPASGNSWLLTEVLRDELGFDGFVVSDANAVKSLRDAALRGRQLPMLRPARSSAGLDMEMCHGRSRVRHPAPGRRATAWSDENAIDVAVRRVLTAKFRLGLFENPYVDESFRSRRTPGYRSTATLARTAAERSVVLLKNDRHPAAGRELDRLDRGDRPARRQQTRHPRPVGVRPRHRRDRHHPRRHPRPGWATPCVSITHRAPASRIALFPSQFDRQDPTVAPTPRRTTTTTPRSHARSNWQRQPTWRSSSWASDRIRSARTPRVHTRPARAPARATAAHHRRRTPRWCCRDVGPPARSALGRSRTSPRSCRLVPGHARRRGRRCACCSAMSRPAGRLPFTWPRHVGQVPLVYSHYRTFAPENQDKRYWDEESTPLYPFGHGLSYASFEYDGPARGAPRRDRCRRDRPSVSVDVTQHLRPCTQMRSCSSTSTSATGRLPARSGS